MGLVIPQLDEVWLVNLDPTIGSEIQKTRPCVIVSPDDMNQLLRTVVVAPMTHADRPYATRVNAKFQGSSGQIALDQIRSIDRQRLIRKLGRVTPEIGRTLSALLVEMFTRGQPVHHSPGSLTQ